MLIIILFFTEAKSAIVSVTFAASGTPRVQLIFKVQLIGTHATLLRKQNYSHPLGNCYFYADPRHLFPSKITR